MTTNNDDLATVCRALKAHGSGEQGEKAFNYLNKIEAVVEESVNVDDTVYNPKSIITI